MALFMTGYLTLMNCSSLVYQEFAPFLSSTITPSRLGLDETPPVVIYSLDLKKGKHFIPVDADLLFRLQHNALFLGYRLQHLPSATTVCHHGCGVLEAAPHLFWYCDFAVHVWSVWLAKFQSLFGSSLEWDSVLLFKLESTPSANTTFG